MRRLSLLALAVVALPVSPAAAAEPAWTGFACGFASTNLPVVDPDRNHQYGEVDGGPFAALPADLAEPVITTTITCSIQVNQPHAGGTPAASASATGSGAVAVLPPTTITYTAEETDSVYVCTTVTAVTRSATYTYRFDGDDFTPGDQCYIPLSEG